MMVCTAAAAVRSRAPKASCHRGQAGPDSLCLCGPAGLVEKLGQRHQAGQQHICRAPTLFSGLGRGSPITSAAALAWAALATCLLLLHRWAALRGATLPAKPDLWGVRRPEGPDRAMCACMLAVLCLSAARPGQPQSAAPASWWLPGLPGLASVCRAGLFWQARPRCLEHCLALH